MNRLASGGLQPDTQRTGLTRRGQYYHLALRGSGPGATRRSVLLSAMSGELFRMAKDSREEAERLTFLHRADTLVVLVDGERIATTKHRTSAQADAADILDSLLDARMVRPNCHVEVVFSKFDRIVAAGEVALEFLARTQEKFEGKFRTRIPHLTFRKIAARPATLSTLEETALRTRSSRGPPERHFPERRTSRTLPLPAVTVSSVSSAGGTLSRQGGIREHPGESSFHWSAQLGEDHLLGRAMACAKDQGSETSLKLTKLSGDRTYLNQIAKNGESARRCHARISRRTGGRSPSRGRGIRCIRALNSRPGRRSVQTAAD